MHPSDQLLIPILFRFIDRPPDRVDVDLRALAFQLSHFAITESLAKRRESLEKVSDLGHGEDSTADHRDASWLAPGGREHQSCYRNTPMADQHCLVLCT